MQAPSNLHSQDFPKQSAQSSTAVSFVKEQAKLELLDAIKEQNTKHGGREKQIEERYCSKVAKFEQRGNNKKKSQELATKQIQRVWSKIFKQRLATPGTKQGEIYKDIGDSDGEGAIFLLKKYLFGKRFVTTDYLSHEQIENRAQATNLSDEKMMRIFLDGGGIPGVTVTTKEAKGLKSAWKESRIVIDHHPEGASSTTHMVAKMLEMMNLIPAGEKAAVQKFVQTIDIVDSFLSRAGRSINVENDYAKTLIALSYQLDSEELFGICQKLPKEIGALSPLPADFLAQTEVTMKWKKEKTKLTECVQKKQVNVDTGATMIAEKIKQKQFVSLNGKKFLIFGPKDNISNDVRALLCAEHDYGTIKIHENSDIFMVHDQGIGSEIQHLGLCVRDVIFLLNPKTSNGDLTKNRETFCKLFAGTPGYELLCSLLQKQAIEENDTKQQIDAETKKSNEGIQSNEPESFVQKVASSPTTPLEPSTKQQIKTKSYSPQRPIFTAIREEFMDFSTNLRSLGRSFLNRIRKR